MGKRDKLSEDFIHLSQIKCSAGKDDDFRYYVAVILESCIEGEEGYDEKYKVNAVRKLTAMTRGDERIKIYLEYFASGEDSECKAIKPIAAEIVARYLQSASKTSDPGSPLGYANSKI